MTEHKYISLADSLRADIDCGKYKAGQRLPSENVLAEKTGYSRQTVRQAIGLLVSEGRAEKRRGSGTYVTPLPSDRQRTNNIAVVTTYIGEYIFPDILHGIEETLCQNGYTPMLAATENRVDNERRVLLNLLGKPIDGIIAEGTKTALPNPNIDIYERFKKLGIPVVFINGCYSELKNPVYVTADDFNGGKTACEYLIGRGHTKIGGIFKGDDMQGHKRYGGYSAALRDNSLEVTDSSVLWFNTENGRELVTASVCKTLDGCTAAVCYNDEIAATVISAFAANNLTPPELVSFDKSRISTMLGDGFKSLSVSAEDIGRLSAKKIINILNGKKESPTCLKWKL